MLPRSVFWSVQDLFDEQADVEAIDSAAPLATRMRPRSLQEFVGQEHILGPGKLLRRAIEADRLPSVIFHGPPGSGKTTLARVIAEMTHAKFVRISGVESNVAEMRRVLAAATNRLRTSGQKTILFVDEIHHFNKAQQDILLPDVEAGNLRLTLAVAEESIQQKAVVYDRVGDAHYDTISAFIKSMRGSDEKGAMYWLAKMLHAGEDFRFIARRIVIFASEDVGLADREALQLAIATQQAVEFVGMPEARIPLAHATAYMCRAPKSREAYKSLNAATERIEAEQTKAVPEHLKNKHFPVNPEN